MEGEVQVTESAPTEAPASADVSHEAVQEKPLEQSGKPAGFDKVDFTPEQQDRVNRLYGNMKRYEKDANELRSDNQRLIQTVNELMAGQQQIVSHIQGSDYRDAESRLRSERDAAWDRGDKPAYHDANDKLNELIVKKSLLEVQKKTHQAQTQVQNQRPSGERIVERALERSQLSDTDANIARSWMSETDTGGNLKRPWTQESDPRNYAAALEGQAVFNSPAWSDKPLADKLREIDRRMGVQNISQSQNVLPSGNLTRAKQSNNIKLEPEIERLAIRTKFGGPNAKSDQDHIEAWKKAVLKSQSKGARR